MENVNVCRTCLSDTNPLSDVFTILKTHDNFSVTLMACTSIQVYTFNVNKFLAISKLWFDFR